MHMMAYFVKMVNLFLLPDQVLDEENTIIDPRFNVIANLPLPLIGWDEEYVNDLKILTKPIEARKKQWINGKISQLKLQGATLTYGELKDELERETNSGTFAAPSGETSKSPPTTISKKRKEVEERQPKHKVYSRSQRASPPRNPRNQVDSLRFPPFRRTPSMRERKKKPSSQSRHLSPLTSLPLLLLLPLLLHWHLKHCMRLLCPRWIFRFTLLPPHLLHLLL